MSGILIKQLCLLLAKVKLKTASSLLLSVVARKEIEIKLVMVEMFNLKDHRPGSYTWERDGAKHCGK